MRTETDSLGKIEIPDNSLYGVHSARALENFPLGDKKVDIDFIKSYAKVKKAAGFANMNCKLLDEDKFNAIDKACDEIILGNHYKEFVVHALSGGAGTSLNMNLNEVIANRALQILGRQPGNYDIIHPVNHVNLSQSTNDTYPTALKITLIFIIRQLHEKLERLQDAFQQKEAEFYGYVKMGRTQLQDAVPITLGMEFSAYSEAISRDRWRLYKMEERLRYVNIGGTAVGTGLNATKKYQFIITEKLREITGIGIARPENLIDVTQNADVFVEVSGLLKSCAVSMNKIANDLRLLASGPKCGFSEIKLPAVQLGSSIMPYKINPVIAEAVNQVCFNVFGNDVKITAAAAAGQLELNAFLPVIADSLIESIKLLTNAAIIFREKCILGIEANVEHMRENVHNSLGVATVFVPQIGYENAGKVVKHAMDLGISVKKAVVDLGLLDQPKVDEIFENLANLLKPGT